MLELKGVSKAFRGRGAVLEEVSWTADQGERVAIVAASGSGKTTLLRLIAGLEKVDRGEIYIDGVLASRPGEQLEPWRRNVGFVFQRPALWPHLNLVQNIGFGLRALTATERRHRVAELVCRMGLEGLERRYPSTLSGGEARRAELARTLAPSPRLLLLDEPFTHLDPGRQRQLESLVAEEIARAGSTLILVTHVRAEAERLCPRILSLVPTGVGRACTVAEPGAVA